MVPSGRIVEAAAWAVLVLIALASCTAQPPPPTAPAAPTPTLQSPAPPSGVPVDWARAPQDLALRSVPFRFEQDPATGLVRALEMGVEGRLEQDEWPMAFIRVHPELFGPADAYVATGEGRWTQRFSGLEVIGSQLEASVNAEGRVVLTADIARPPALPPPAPGTRADALEAAQRWLSTSELAGLGGELSAAAAVWFDPGLLAPPVRGLRPCWRVGSPPATAGTEGGAAEVLVDATDLTVVGAWDRRSPPSQTWSALWSYVPPPGLTRPGFDRVLAALDLSAGERVADVGAGSGALSWPLSRAVGPTGRVYATDVDPAAIAFMRWRLAEDAPPFPNVDVRFILVDDPGLPPASVDAILLWEAHFFMQREPAPALRAYLAALHTALRPEGRLVVIESTGNGPEEIVRGNFAAAGFGWLETLPGFPGSTAAVLGP